MIRAVWYLATEAIWSLVFYLAPFHPLDPPEPDRAQRIKEEEQARTEWIRDHRRQP